MRRLPPLGAIQAFVNASRLGSLKAAAESLSLSSPALSRRIQTLEHFVGATLFQREHNAVVLNSEGQRFLSEVAPHYDALAAAVDRASASDREIRLRIAVPSLFASQKMVPALPSLLLRHPNIRIELVTKLDRLARLDEGVDAAIVISDGVDSSYYSKVLARGRVVALGSKTISGFDAELDDPSQLARLPALLHRDMPRTFEVWCAGVGRPDLEPAERIYFDSGQLVLDAAAEALGVAYMLDSHLLSSTDGRLTQLSKGSVESPYAYWFTCSPTALSRPSIKAFHDWIFETFLGASEFAEEAQVA